ncbi:hypothetical protein ACMGDK_11560 [Chryseobacterium sp. DT-3]|uniref:hypothetical protein n=1 Tax=Chryseobacterium sp. DT-3 TaxID=3396164 RepID=UPI003F1E3148
MTNKTPTRLQNHLNDIRELSRISGLESVNTDLIRMMFGQKINEGSYRSVYEYNFDPNKYVIKIEPNSTESNANEFLIWEEVSGLCGNLSWVKDWFAPVLFMSPDAKILVMERTFPYKTIRGKDLVRPEKIPDFFSDVKFSNFGWLGNKLVCHDYGFINRFIKYDKKFRKANW